MEIEFVAAQAALADKTALAVIVFEGDVLAGAAGELDAQAGGALGRAVAGGRFTGAKGQVLDVHGAPGASPRIVLVGAGKADAFDDLAVENAAASAYGAVKASGLAILRLRLPKDGAHTAAQAALGVRLAAYRFDRYRTKEPAEKKPTVIKTQIVTDEADAALAAFPPYAALADAVAFSRDLVSEPPNVLYPEEFARRVKALESLGLEVEILGEAEMAKLGMGSLLGVGQGSTRESQLAVIKWYGAKDKKAQPIAFVGKGVCFDTGGISLKPADGMEDMKWDMGGAGAVAGLMHVLAGRKAKVNAIGILGLVENMPDGNAQRPGDVVTSMSGQTIEIINTDAEGRLVLADAVWYCQDRFKPKFMVDLATLTGAIIISLGNDYAGLFSNNDELSANLLAASTAEGEPLWRMPLPPQYDKNIDSVIADMKNTGGRPGGSITAALFIQRFANGLPWAHLDIASTAWKKPSSVPTIPEGATGYGVRLLNRMVADKYES
ncbi:leucyl aminopeptidase [Phenylobacterium sp. LH3H17]|uniref:leucyl aminopeptidase n=1 Tax=Phenylobacterium sp. LH3H17 TaxID=2903901 RepID=UPI0020C9BD0D|nr:leucyl aminopeptidase [Phenylobacterium sp. LH3H17]UTP37862.1 leucyl aminopeptidase [Phenylobacterium sp. LH3H17]